MGNHQIRHYDVRHNDFKDFIEYVDAIEDLETVEKYKGPEDVSGEEYNRVGLFFGNIVTVLRSSLGDFDFGATIVSNMK